MADPSQLIIILHLREFQSRWLTVELLGKWRRKTNLKEDIFKKRSAHVDCRGINIYRSKYRHDLSCPLSMQSPQQQLSYSIQYDWTNYWRDQLLRMIIIFLSIIFFLSGKFSGSLSAVIICILDQHVQWFHIQMFWHKIVLYMKCIVIKLVIKSGVSWTLSTAVPR